MAQQPRLLEPAPDWTADERPTLPGSPAAIQHAPLKRLCYLLTGIFIAIAASLSNGFISANLSLIQGEYALTPSEVAWLPAVYVMANVSSNLILFKARQQYGLRLFSEIGLLLFIAVLLLHLMVQTFEMALFVRFMSGLVAAPLSSLGMYYIMQAFRRVHFGKGIYLALGLQQLGVPLAWIISPALVDINNWSMLYSFELGLALCCFAMVVALKLPRSLKIAVFEKQDFLTFALLAPGFACLCIVLTQGPIVWWLDAPQLAYWLIAGLSLVMLGLCYEHFRVNPLIMTRWIGTASVINFVFAALAIRIIMSEQSFAAVNFLKTMGMGPDQFVPLYVVIFLGITAGTLFSALSYARERIFLNLLLAEALILIACALDYHLTSAVRPENFFLSQFLVGFAGGAFIGPLLLTGMISALQKGPTHIVTFIVLFSATQNFGGLIGNAFFSTYQQYRSQNYKMQIISDLSPTEPLLQQRLQSDQQRNLAYLSDPQRRQQQALLTLNQKMTQEAQVRAYNDVIALNGVFALILLLWGSANIAWTKYRLKKLASTLAAKPSTNPSSISVKS
ncbi:MFS transporter [Acinetobacter larvae]|uniref:MFS transporter n=1 Tax=Acinetobacter larvae TaxID=1789224 RepID=A0A1B2LWT1_9GAMM|nr:MFS transporter [Acinetobacter larvae]AOA57394.1 MFS transporter [Acinetobacter larvae]